MYRYTTRTIMVYREILKAMRREVRLFFFLVIMFKFSQKNKFDFWGDFSSIKNVYFVEENEKKDIVIFGSFDEFLSDRMWRRTLFHIWRDSGKKWKKSDPSKRKNTKYYSDFFSFFSEKSQSVFLFSRRK